MICGRAEVFIVGEDGKPVLIGRASEMQVELEANTPALWSECPLTGQITISYTPSQRMIDFLTDRKFLRLRRQMRAKLRGRNWRNVR